jgi:alkylation response protein AidB-like acyl-CoA dehydrogenase
MDFDLSPDQAALAEAASALLAAESSSAKVRDAADRDGFDRALWQAMVDQGWLGIMMPESSGGLGLGTIEAAVLLEQSGAHLTPVPLLQQLHALTELRGTIWAEPMMAGERIGTVCYRSLQRNADGTVSGSPEPVIYGAVADVLVAPTYAGDLVAIDLKGIQRVDEPAMDRTRRLAAIDLESVDALTIGATAEVEHHTDLGATFHAAELLGSARAVMDLAVEYAKVREQFGRPIGSFQAVKHRCADMLVDVEAMHSAAYHAAWSVGALVEPGVAASTAKIWCSEAGLRVAESSLQVHGGVGFTWESDVHLYLKRIQLGTVAFGNAREHRSRLAAMLRTKLERGESLI